MISDLLKPELVDKNSKQIKRLFQKRLQLLTAFMVENSSRKEEAKQATKH